MKLFFTLLISLAATCCLQAQAKRYVYFDSNKSALTAGGQATLDSLVVLLKDMGQYPIVISGYCDSTGTHGGNISLSEQRAERVYEYLKAKGVDTTRMTRKGYAEARDNSDEERKARNRRVEVSVLVGKSITPTVSNPRSLDPTTFARDAKVGATYRIDNLNFRPNQAVLVMESVSTLLTLLQIMQQNPTLKIEIGGHVCCSNDMPLSVARAKFVYDYLVHKGIDSTRMTYKGYGRTRPIIENDELERDAKINRRVEITVLKK
jgi:outer membrane protein OmpA-like peptidoglycan-associated protein